MSNEEFEEDQNYEQMSCSDEEFEEKQSSEQMSFNEEDESEDQKEIHLHQTPVSNIQEDQFNQNTTSISGNDFTHSIDPNSSNQSQNSYSQNRPNYSLQSTAMIPNPNTSTTSSSSTINLNENNVNYYSILYHSFI